MARKEVLKAERMARKETNSSLEVNSSLKAN